MMTISTIVKKSSSIDKVTLWKALHSKNMSRVILRRFLTNICICMAPNGSVITERFINQTITDICQWRLRVSRHGIGFEHHSIDHEQFNSNSKLVVIRTLSAGVGSNWAKIVPNNLSRMWSPQSTWQVFGVDQVLLSNVINSINSSAYTLNVSEHWNRPKHKPHVNVQSNRTKEVETTIKVGSQDVAWLEAPAHHFNTLQHHAKMQYCSVVKNQLVRIVQYELLYSLKIIEKLRTAYRQLLKMAKYSNTISINSSHVATLFDQWLMLHDYKWRARMRKFHAFYSNFYNQSIQLPCLYSFYDSSFERHLVESDVLLAQVMENRVHMKINHDMFEYVYRVVNWTDDQKSHWIQYPQLTKLFHFLQIDFPAKHELRQSSFLLHQYLSEYSPESASSQTFHFGMQGTLGVHSFIKFLKTNKNANYIVDRAVYLKFEEYRFWPVPKLVKSGKLLEHSLYVDSNLRHQIQQLKSKHVCYDLFVKRWIMYRQKGSYKKGKCTSINR